MIVYIFLGLPETMNQVHIPIDSCQNQDDNDQCLMHSISRMTDEINNRLSAPKYPILFIDL